MKFAEKQKKTVVINGKFYSQPVSGVQRYAREMVLELDKLVGGENFILAVNKHAKNIPDLKNIKTVCVGRLCGNLWEQLSLPRLVKKEKALCASLCNIAPILSPHIVTIHDVSFKVNKPFFSRKFTAWYNFNFALTMKKIRKVITVSEFSKAEIIREYGVSPGKISVTYNGWQHFERIDFDDFALEKFGLKKGNYFFSISNLAPNKNLKWIAENARLNPQENYAVAGAVNKKVFGETFGADLPPNLRLLGYASDGEAKALMRDCKAFLYPTFYEGFGIPPLEAISAGARAVVSDASCMREIYGDSVNYIDPKNPDVNLGELLKIPVCNSEEILKKYSWENSAKALYDCIREELKKG